MFKKLTLKQKVIIGVIGLISIIIIGSCFYLFSQEGGTNMDLNQMFSLEQNNVEEGLNISKDNQNNTEKVDEDEEKIIIHITGEIEKPGIIVLKQGDRIVDAITQAGGTTKEADLNEVNLAYELQDGQKVYIPNKKDKEKNETKVYITSESGNNVITQGNNSESKGGNKKVNINEASQSELETLTGIGSSIASRIIEYREQNGKFKKIEELQNVKGIGESKFANIKDAVTVK